MARTTPSFSLQWHVTAKCDQRCRHCYMVRNPAAWKEELLSELSQSDCLRVIDDLVDFCNNAGARPGITFTGGDPLLRDDFFDLCDYARQNNVMLRILGNPFYLDRPTITRLRALPIGGYQISIDGLEKTHDSFRKSGSFRSSIDALLRLKEAGIRTVVMFTLSAQNVDDLLPVMSLMADLQIDVFGFARFCGNPDDPVGISPRAYRQLLLDVQEHAKKLAASGARTHFNHKDHLWKLLHYEQGTLIPPDNPDNLIISGCSLGRSALAILADGTVYACRRFRSPIGHVPQDRLIDIFTSEKLDQYRQVEMMEKCRTCELLYLCRGCPAVAHAESDGNFLASDPQCWK